MNDLQHLPPLLLPAPRLLVDNRDGAGWLAVPATVRINGYPPYIALATAILADHLHLAEATLADFGILCVDGDPPEPALNGSEAYRLRIDTRRIHLAAHGEAGMRQGLHTLVQLITQYGRRLPCLLIEDAPVFAVRGVMLDVSRDRVPTMAHLLETVDQLAGWKINHLQLYTEHTFAYAGHEEVWREASPLTADEMRTLDAHCRAHGIELAANQNCFGHLASWLKHPRYAPLGEIAPDAEWDFNGLVMRRGPFSLCPGDPRALALVEDLLGQLLPTVAGPLVNIGCDETFDLGQGRSKDEVARRGRAAVYLEFVRAICAVVRRHGKRPMFWADIALEHPEALAELPADLIGLAWGYEPDAPFARWCQQLRAAGREVWVCPGT
ncbi:MAG: family 20 glycosylhydrolase, partial [Planctomycetes bacterium]|nr:family 20 glycosylhydrolase [Planctomycetota bacterium]